ncbi:apolipoprotein N-acyltransferase [Methylotuvimicrobium sp. KM2]|uniref:apolipoprotein N-acyltransferase n=1 Tax=Methylotuvimicrobium sp. KM2 TaxID=3133976 RepID=UPI00310168D5
MPETAFNHNLSAFFKGFYGDLFAPAAGIAMALAFAPFDHAYLGFVALAFIFASWEVLTPARAALRGFLFGLGLFGFGVSWVFVSVRVYGGADLLSSVVITLLFVSVWSLFPALTGYLTSAIARRSDLAINSLIPPCIWILVEYIRGNWFLNGFPWLQIAYSQLDTPFSGYIPIIGVYGTGFLMALSAGLALQCRHGKRHIVTNLTLIAVLFASGALCKNISWTHSIGENIRVSLLQGNIPQEQKWAPENRDSTLRKYRELTEKHWYSDIIVWPETSIPAYYSEVKENFIEPLERKAVEHNSNIIVSLPMKGDQPHVKYNSVLVLGKQRSIYHKNHLLPFGEYLPLQPLSGKILDFLNMRLGHFTPGGDDQTLPIAAGHPFAASICYEDAISKEARTKLPDAAFLVNVTNDAWFGQSIEPFQHLQIARMRALETGRYLLRATNTGVTAIVSPMGGIIKQAIPFETAAISGIIKPMGGLTPYAKTGNAPAVSILVALLIASMSTQIKYNRRTQSRQRDQYERGSHDEPLEP